MTRHYKDIIGNINESCLIECLRIGYYELKTLYLLAFLRPYRFFFFLGAAGRRQFRRRLRFLISTFGQRLLISCLNLYLNNILIEACKRKSAGLFRALASHLAHGGKSSQTRCRVISDTLPSHLRHLAGRGFHNCGYCAESFRTLLFRFSLA
jgi:hypothetical protein